MLFTYFGLNKFVIIVQLNVIKIIAIFELKIIHNNIIWMILYLRFITRTTPNKGIYYN